jgi:hypothetical protein
VHIGILRKVIFRCTSHGKEVDSGLGKTEKKLEKILGGVPRVQGTLG